MTLKEAYESVESNYDNVLKRLGSEGMIKRFAVKFIDDPTFGELKNALAAGDGESAFRAAHTMKGICLNLGFDKLYEVSADLTEQLRGYEITGSEAVYQQVVEQYDRLIAAIKAIACAFVPFGIKTVSIFLTVPDTLECIGADINAVLSPTSVPTNT